MAILEKAPGTALVADTALPSEDYVPRTMPGILGVWDMTATFMVAIFLATTATTAALGGPAAITYLVLAGLTFFVPCIVATMQLGTMFPHEGSLYNWTHKAIGGKSSFFAGFCAWFPGVLIAASFGDLLVTYIQNMNSKWLVTPWQQGIVIILVLAFAGLLSVQRFRTVQNVINVLVCLSIASSLLIGLSGILWLASGHASVTNFSHWGDWGINPGNYVLFGFMIFAYIGTEGPLNLAGELRAGQERTIIKRHLLVGGLLIALLYLMNTFSVLVVLGPSNGSVPFALVMVVDTVLGKFLGSVTAIFLMGSFVATALVYNYVFARLLLVGSIDRRLPRAVGKLNANRVPANAIIFQTTLAILFTLLAFVVAPLLGVFGNPLDFSTEVYTVSQAAATLVWAISASFLFIDLVGCYLRNRWAFSQWRIVPLPVLWACVVVGSLSCFLAIIDTLLYAWIPQISNSQWWYLVGGLTLIFLIIAAVGSMFANSEASWQEMSME